GDRPKLTEGIGGLLGVRQKLFEVIRGLLGVRWELTEGDQELAGDTLGVHQKMTETHREFVGGYWDLGMSLDTLVKLIVIVWHSEEWPTPLRERHHEDKQVKKNA
ncbi:hypothetical protein B296_00005463, partial [Ensete ventricosum]